ncbi:MAG: SufD family Fe-S cluster assembly protein [Alphaproteobacteria bacterium]
MADQTKFVDEGIAWLAANAPQDAGIADARVAGAKALAELGLPSKRVEAWKYTDLRRFLGASNSNAKASCLTDAVSPQITLSKGGAMVGALPSGVAHADRTDFAITDGLSALRSGAATGSVALTIEEGAAEPLHILNEGGANAVAITVKKFATLTLMESSVADGLSQTLLSITLEDGAKLRHVRLKDSPADSADLTELSVTVGRDATYEQVSVILNAGQTRVTVDANLSAPGCHMRMNAAALLDGQDHFDLSARTNHAIAHCDSHQLYKMVAADKAHGVMQGLINVAEGADDTDAHLLSKSLLLDATATIHQKPELTIFADEVVCSHGATCGALDADALFYLRSRGIPERQARALLIAAFLDDVLLPLADWPDGERLAAILREALQARFDAIVKGAGA